MIAPLVKRALGWMVVLALAAGSGGAQFQGRIEGTVSDPEGNPLEKVEVFIVSMRTTSMRFTVRTDKAGRFTQIGLQPGYFQLNFKKEGFAPQATEVHVGIAGAEQVRVTLRTVDQAVARTLSEADRLFVRGNGLFAEQKFEEAGAVYRQAVELDASNWGYHLNLGLAMKKLDRLEEAKAAFAKAAELNPGSYSANKELAEALGKAGDFAAARTYYGKAAALSPQDPDARYNLGVCLMNMGESEAALVEFSRATELQDGYADAWYYMGTIYVGQNKVPEAVASLEKFLALAPDHAQAPVARQILQVLKK